MTEWGGVQVKREGGLGLIDSGVGLLNRVGRGG